jgi:hypothetical protein
MAINFDDFSDDCEADALFDGDHSDEGDPEQDNATLERGFWNESFAEDEKDGAPATEWLLSYETVGHFFRPYLVPGGGNVGAGAGAASSGGGAALVLGCGNSDFSAGMSDDGVSGILSVDFSDVVIDQMRRQYAQSHPDMQWAVADCRDLTADLGAAGSSSSSSTAAASASASSPPRPPPTYADGSFRYVVDKSLFDCMFWAEREKRHDALDRMVAETFRVLAPVSAEHPEGGVALFLIQRTPEEVEEYLGRHQWTVEYAHIAASCNSMGSVDKDSVAVLARDSESAFPAGTETEELYLYVCRGKGGATRNKAKKGKTGKQRGKASASVSPITPLKDSELAVFALKGRPGAAAGDGRKRPTSEEESAGGGGEAAPGSKKKKQKACEGGKKQ